MTSVKAHCNEGITPSEYVACLIRDFGRQGEASIDWKKIGLDVPHAFKRAPGCCTMLGPMNVEIKQRAVVTRKKHVRPTESSRPEELDESTEERTKTDKNMATMFNILRKNRRVRLERIVLNRDSFAEMVENIFALSFLVKDDRAEITVDEKGCHIVSPKNAPAANAVASGEVSYSHFIFRFDFKDWKLCTLLSLELNKEHFFKKLEFIMTLILIHRDIADCSDIGISILKPPSSSPPPTLSDKSSNQGAATHADFKKVKDKVMPQRPIRLYTYSVSETMQLKDGSKTSHTYMEADFYFFVFLISVEL